jgi:hypothetical protein
MNDDTPTNELPPGDPAALPTQVPHDAPPPRLTRNRKIAIIGGAAAVIGLGALTAPVVAQTIKDDDRDRGDRHEQFERELEEKLGVPQARVDAALQAMQGDRLTQRVAELQEDGALTAAQATAITAKVESGDLDGALKELRAALTAQQLTALVKAGAITQAQADEVSALVKAGVPIGLKGSHHGDGAERQHRESAEHQQQHVEKLQERGAITAQQAAELNALIAAGKTAEAETAIHPARDAHRLDQLVEDGTMTQGQADQVTALMAAGVPIGLGGPGLDGGHHGKGGGHHGQDMDGGHHRNGSDHLGDAEPGSDASSQTSRFDSQTLGDERA